MLQQLSQNFYRIVRNLNGQSRLTEANMADTLREVRQALLEADVALPVVKNFIDNIQTHAVNRRVVESLTPGQTLIGIVQQELTHLLGEKQVPLNFAVRPPAVILVAGLQGVGKTTSVGKIAYSLKKKKKVLAVSCDINRPAAMEQLKVLCQQAGVAYFAAETGMTPADIVQGALAKAKKEYFEVLLVDSAGRLAIDEEMMNEIASISKILNPVETLYVLDAMQGQDAVVTASTFHQRLPLTGLVITKLDGDARGGAALSVRHITQCPIKFMGTSEKLDGLEVFDPQRLASRILGMGDIGSILEKTAELSPQVGKEQAKRIQQGQFNFIDFKESIAQMSKLGGANKIMDALPMQLRAAIPSAGVDDKQFVVMGAIIDSMTKQEREAPDILKASRKKRIAMGAGVSVHEVNMLIQRFEQIHQMMKKFKNPKMMMGLVNSLGKPRGGRPYP